MRRPSPRGTASHVGRGEDRNHVTAPPSLCLPCSLGLSDKKSRLTYIWSRMFTKFTSTSESKKTLLCLLWIKSPPLGLGVEEPPPFWRLQNQTNIQSCQCYLAECRNMPVQVAYYLFKGNAVKPSGFLTLSDEDKSTPAIIIPTTCR